MAEQGYTGTQIKKELTHSEETPLTHSKIITTEISSTRSSTEEFRSDMAITSETYKRNNMKLHIMVYVNPNPFELKII